MKRIVKMRFFIVGGDAYYKIITQKSMAKKKEIRLVEQEHEAVPSDDYAAFFYTFDLGLSAALISVGFSLVSLNHGNLRKVQFVFRRGDGMDETVDAYWADRLEVKSRTYFDTLKMLKNRLYSE